jgi:hypothetical protein
MTDPDIIEVLKLFKTRTGATSLATVAEISDGLGCDEATAQSRVDGLVSSGYLSPSIWGVVGDDEERELGHGLLKKGKDALIASA